MAENTEAEKHLKTVAKGAGLVFGGLVFSKILTYFYRLIIARYYGPEDYGLISIVLSVITVLVTVLILGMDYGLVRYISEYRAKNDERRIKGTILTSFKISLPLSIATAILMWFFSPYLASAFAKDPATLSSLTIIFRVFSFTLPFSVFYQLLLAACKGFQRIDYPVYSDNVFYSIVLVSSVSLFSLIGLGIIGIAWSYALTVIASLLLIFYFFNRHVFNLFAKMKTASENKTLLKYTTPLFIGSIATIAIGSFDSIFLGFFKTAADVGVYNAALPTAKFILVFSSTFGALFLPIMVEYKAKSMIKETRILYRTTTKWVFFFGLPFALLMIFFSKNVLNVLFGADYLPATGALSILSLAFFIQAISLTSNLVLSIESTKYVMMSAIVAAIMNIILNAVLIPSLGILGAAIATSLSVIFTVTLQCLFAWKFTRINPFDWKACLKAFLAVIISMSLIVFLYRYSGIVSSAFTLIPLFLIFLAVYSLLIVAFRTLDKNDIFILVEIERKLGIRIKFARRIFKLAN